MTATAYKPVIVALEHPASFEADNFDVVDRVFRVRKEGFFLAIPLSMLWKHSQFVARLIERYGKPKIFFVQLDAPHNAFLDKLKQQPWKSMANRAFAFSQWDEVARIMHAWGCDMPEDTIAAAFVEGDKLVVIDCTLKRREIKFVQLRSLSCVDEEQRTKFEIGEWGENLCWPAYHLHVDIIDAIRFRTDKAYRKEKELQSLTHYREYGRAILETRKSLGLTRESIENHGEISAKTVQRVESGKTELSLKTLAALATAHGMDTKKYLNLLAKKVQELRQLAVEYQQQLKRSRFNAMQEITQLDEGQEIALAE